MLLNLQLGSRQSRHFGKSCTTLTTQGYQVTIKEISYELQKGGNQLLTINPVKPL